MTTIGPLIRTPTAIASQSTKDGAAEPLTLASRIAKRRASAPMAATIEAVSTASVLASLASTPRRMEAHIKAAAMKA